jgi:hypothetical protein
MRGADVRALPVVQRGVVVGILIKTDLDPFRGREEWSTVQLAMEAPLTVAPEARVAEVPRALLDRGVQRCPWWSMGPRSRWSRGRSCSGS